jgi:hypothetical protein
MRRLISIPPNFTLGILICASGIDSNLLPGLWVWPDAGPTASAAVACKKLLRVSDIPSSLCFIDPMAVLEKELGRLPPQEPAPKHPN